MATTISEQYVVMMFGLLLWREARGQSYDEIVAVACSVRNRVRQPGWWGKTYLGVITHAGQYSSFPWINRNGTVIADANGMRFPIPEDSGWTKFLECCGIAENVIKDIKTDTVNGATHYYDKTLDSNPPAWTKVPDSQHICDIGPFRFWKAK
jgi:hypothetical protein